MNGSMLEAGGEPPTATRETEHVVTAEDGCAGVSQRTCSEESNDAAVLCSPSKAHCSRPGAGENPLPKSAISWPPDVGPRCGDRRLR